MRRTLHRWLLLFSISTCLSKEEELPLCPSNMQFFPQNLPMHCRMPTNADFSMPDPPQMPTMPPFPSFFQNSPNKPISMPLPSFPGLPGGIPMPGSMPMPGPMPIPGPMPGPLPGPMMPGVPPHKLPVIVMPFYSPDPSYKRPGTRRPMPNEKKRRPFKRPRFDSDDTSTDTDTDTDYTDTSDESESSERGWWKGHKKGFRRSGKRMNKKHKLRRKPKKKKDLLTPILQYVTKDGYVIFEKQISKDEAKDWLKTKNENDAAVGEVGNFDDRVENINVQKDPNVDVEEVNTKESDKREDEGEPSPANHRAKKHRHKKQNTLINKAPNPTN